MTMTRSSWAAIIAAVILVPTAGFSQVPNLLDYEGYLTRKDTADPQTGVIAMTFRLYDAVDALVACWTEDRTAAMDKVDVAAGDFTVALGSKTPLPDKCDFSKALWLGVTVEGDTNELLPRQELVSVPYAFRSQSAQTVTDVSGNKATIQEYAQEACYVASGPLPVAHGGTGATAQNFVDLTSAQTVGGAKTFTSTIDGSIAGNAATVTNGLYSTGSYSQPTWLASVAGSIVSGDITGNAGNVNGVVGVSNGGTGMNLLASGGPGQYVQQPTAGGGFTVGPMATTDLPAGSGHYIQNQTGAVQNAGFNIGGDGYFGGRIGIGTANPPLSLSFGTPEPSIGVDTVAGMDNKRLILTSASSWSTSRGGSIVLSGNQHADAGAVAIAAGYGSAGVVGDITFSGNQGEGQYEAMRVQGRTGNVGIGTTTPSARLEVAGGVRILGDAQGQTQFFPPGEPQSRGIGFRSTTETANHGANAWIYLERQAWKSPGTGDDFADKVGVHIDGFYDGMGSGLPIFLGGMSYNQDLPWVTIAGGNVGIGTTGPKERLSVAGGNVAVKDGALYVQTTAAPGHSDENSLVLVNHVNDYSEVFNNAGKPLALQVTVGGRVGIGTSNPTETLEVVGGIKVGDSTCSASHEGTLRYATGSPGHFFGCRKNAAGTGFEWSQLDL